MLKNTKLKINAALGGILLSTISTVTMAQDGNPFQAKALPQGYMVLAENTLPEPPPPPDKAMSSASTNAPIQSNVVVKKSTKLLSDIKSSKAQDGGCGAGSCAAKLNKVKGQNLAK
jgi:uncharacterized low-complexity protein